MDHGIQSEVGQLKRVLMRHPREAFGSPEQIERQWRSLDYVHSPDWDLAVREFDALTDLLSRLGAQPVYLPSGSGLTLDSIYTRDSAILSPRGLILCRMGKSQRQAEPEVLRRQVPALGLSIAGEIQGDGVAEGGDVVWLNSTTLAAGLGYRTNQAGIEQLRALMGDSVEEFIVVPLPHWKGPSDVFHLMSILSPLDHDLALVYSPLLPVSFRLKLLYLGFQLVEVPEQEFESMGCNVLAVAPRRVVMLEGNPETRRRMEAAGVEVFTYRGNEISVAGCGGPTCLTRPLERGA